jgi:hypothetical protein
LLHSSDGMASGAVRASSVEEFRDRWVHFRIRDVYIPDPQVLLLDLHRDDVLQGRVLDFSDTGMPEGAFAVIKVDEIEQPVIVPVARIRGAL